MDEPRRGRPTTSPLTLREINAMQQARNLLLKCLERFDVVLYSHKNQGVAVQGLDALVREAARALDRFYSLRNGKGGASCTAGGA
jgi:hypothetical protein